jgi:glycerol-1-phosphate dehydrogenase [NAD(P)+]
MEKGDYLHFYAGQNAIEQFMDFCQKRQFERYMLVCDQNTYPVLGQRVESKLREQDWEFKTVILEGEEVIADEAYLVRVLLQADKRPWTYLAVGSGTITDIARFCSHRSRNDFIALPTAPSVDGFASVVAPLVVQRFKATVLAHPPIAIFADVDVLRQAPHAMIAAGFGDMLGKFTALADWELCHLIQGEPYNKEIAQRMKKALQICVDNVQGIQQASAKGVESLMEGLIESGLCMLANGNSRPASGAEHHLSHYWEMLLLQQRRPAVLHGAKVGIGTVQIARRYEQIGKLSREEVRLRLEGSHLPDKAEEIKTIQNVYGPIASQVLHEQGRFLDLTPADYEAIKQKIYRHWEEIQGIAAKVPSAQDVLSLLEQVSAPTDLSMVGMEEEELPRALEYAHYLRSQFTVSKLGRVLGLW